MVDAMQLSSFLAIAHMVDAMLFFAWVRKSGLAVCTFFYLYICLMIFLGAATLGVHDML